MQWHWVWAHAIMNGYKHVECRRVIKGAYGLVWMRVTQSTKVSALDRQVLHQCGYIYHNDHNTSDHYRGKIIALLFIGTPISYHDIPTIHQQYVTPDYQCAPIISFIPLSSPFAYIHPPGAQGDHWLPSDTDVNHLRSLLPH